MLPGGVQHLPSVRS